MSERTHSGTWAGPVVEPGIPIPKRRTRAVNEEAAKVMESMKPGDSVWLGVSKPWRASNLARRLFGDGNYAVREDRGGYRVWRTK